MMDAQPQHHGGYAGFDATFYDGKTAESHRVQAMPETEGVRIHSPDGAIAEFWPYAALTLLERPRDGIPARLGNRAVSDAQLVIGPEIYALLKSRLPRPKAPYAIAGLIGLLILIVAATLFWVIPTASPMIARNIPYRWEEKLGNLIYPQITRGQRHCTDPEVQRILHSLLSRLREGQTLLPVRVSIVEESLPNAFALPGRRIVVYSGLIQDAQSPEELAGVVAHEIGHVQHGHVMQNLVRALGIGGMLDVVTGGGGAVVTLVAVLHQNQYSREMEREADGFAAELMTQKGFNIAPLADFFIRMEKMGLPLGDYTLKTDDLGWLSTHPTHQERIDFFHAYPAPANPRPVMDAEDWETLHTLAGCGFETNTPSSTGASN